MTEESRQSLLSGEIVQNHPLSPHDAPRDGDDANATASGAAAAATAPNAAALTSIGASYGVAPQQSSSPSSRASRLHALGESAGSAGSAPSTQEPVRLPSPHLRRSASDAGSRSKRHHRESDASTNKSNNDSLIGERRSNMSSRVFVAYDDDSQRQFVERAAAFRDGDEDDLPPVALPVHRLAVAAGVSLAAMRDAVDRIGTVSEHTLTVERLGSAAEAMDTAEVISSWHSPPASAPHDFGELRFGSPDSAHSGEPAAASARSLRSSRAASTTRRVSNATEMADTPNTSISSTATSPSKRRLPPTDTATRPRLPRVNFRPVADLIIFKRHDEILIAVDRAADKRMGWGMLAASYVAYSVYLTHGYFIIERSPDHRATQRYVSMSWYALIYAVVLALAAAGAGAISRKLSRPSATFGYKADPVPMSILAVRGATWLLSLLRTSLPMCVAGAVTAGVSMIGYDVLNQREFFPLTILDGLWMLVYRYFQGAVATQTLEWLGVSLRTAGFVTALYPMVSGSAWTAGALKGYGLFLTSSLAGAAYLILMPGALSKNDLMPLLSVDFATRYILVALLTGVVLAGQADDSLGEAFASPFKMTDGWTLLVALEAVVAQATILLAVRFVDELNAAAIIALVWITVPFYIYATEKLVPTTDFDVNDYRSDSVGRSVAGDCHSNWIAACVLIAVSVLLLFVADRFRKPMEFSVASGVAKRLPNAVARLDRSPNVMKETRVVAESRDPKAAARMEVPIPVESEPDLGNTSSAEATASFSAVRSQATKTTLRE